MESGVTADSSTHDILRPQLLDMPKLCTFSKVDRTFVLDFLFLDDLLIILFDHRAFSSPWRLLETPWSGVFNSAQWTHPDEVNNHDTTKHDSLEGSCFGPHVLPWASLYWHSDSKPNASLASGYGVQSPLWPKRYLMTCSRAKSNVIVMK
jgi:hypothetical protein